MLNPSQPKPTPLAHRVLTLLLAAFVVAGAIVSGVVPIPRETAAQSTNAPIPFRAPDDPWLIRDDARLFNGDQMERFQFDLRRLQGLGEDVMVYTRRADASPSESEGFAKRVREAWDIESAPNADDGLLLLITVSNNSPANNSFVASAGSNFFPLNQTERADFEEIHDTEIEPNFREGRFDVALAFGIRRLLYAADYTPPNPPALTGVNAFAHKVGNIGGAVLLQAAVLGLAIVPALKEHRLTARPARKTVRAYASLFGPAAGLIALFGVVGRSGIGVVAAILTLALVMATMLFFQTPDSRLGPATRGVRVRSAQGRLPRRALHRLDQRRGQYVA